MPRVLHVSLLMMFTPDPPSITHPCISVLCTRTLMTGLWCSMIVGPRLVSVNRYGMVLCGAFNRASIACRNRGTKFKSFLIVSVMGQSARASQIGSASTCFGFLVYRVLTPAASSQCSLRWLLSPIPGLLFLCRPVIPILSSSPCFVSSLVGHRP